MLKRADVAWCIACCATLGEGVRCFGSGREFLGVLLVMAGIALVMMWMDEE